MDCNWIGEDENIIKNSSISNLPPTINSFNRSLGDKEAVKSDNFESISKEARITNNRLYNKKLPISFISPKDWQKYLNFTNSIVNDTDNKKLINNSRGKNGRILRLLNSFHMLYEEYSRIFTNSCSSSSVQNSGDTFRNSTLCLNNLHVGMNEYKNDSIDSIDDNLIETGVQTILTMKQNFGNMTKSLTVDEISCDESDFAFSPYSSIPWGRKNIINPAKKLSQKIKKITSNSTPQKPISNAKSFDKIVKLDNITLEVIEEVRQQYMVCHSLSLANLDQSKFKIPKMKYLQMPLAIELLLPKIQIKIENILNDCPFLCDPLEVAAELRHFGYDHVACIKYFKITKFLRSIIEDMMPIYNNNTMGLSNNDFHIRTQTPSTLSTNSQAVFHEQIEKSNDNVKSLNSNVNHYTGNNNVIKQKNNPNEGNFISQNEISQIQNNKTLIDLKKNPLNDTLVNIDGGTQTNMVHFYVENKNMESIFCKIKHYLTTIKQLHTETKDEIDYLRKQLCCVFTSLKSHIVLLLNQNNEKSISDEQRNKMVTLSRQVEELKLKLKKEEKKRRHAYNLMQEQMGNIRVYCRCRHVADGGSILEFIGNETITLSIAPNERFEFDKVFHPGMSQIELYEEFRPLVMSFIDGYNVCFITYGGEASGKTFTLIGGSDGPNQHGLMQRALTTILMEERLRQRDCEYKITACVVEIYNDNCIDVLSGETNIQLYVDNGMETAYQKLKSVPITNEADAEALMQVCRVKRRVARTALNPSSSRSHLITLIRLQGRSKIHGENICSFLCLCDLAGFEDIIKAETQTNKVLSKEAGYINRSLTAFNRVFVSLRKQDPNTVSYRDTKLTHLLKPFLTNSGKCALVITVRNDKRSLGSTQNTLRFGRETRGVSLGKARRQVNLNGQVSVM